jgi:hypothetical protein
MRYQLKNKIADIDHRFYLHNMKVKEGERAQEDGTTVSGGGYYCFGYEDKHQRIKVQIDKEIKNFKRMVSKEIARPSKSMPTHRTNKK